MKYTLLIILVFSFICTRSMWYDKPKEIEDPLISAIIQVESGGDTLAYNSKEDAVGCLQIRPIMVREVNRLLGEDKYTLKDRWNKAKSIQMFNILRLHTNNPTDEKLARNWNGGYTGHKKKSTLKYWNKVKKQFKKK
jgi:soluble lytic murein transglycosylase-like protein